MFFYAGGEGVLGWFYGGTGAEFGVREEGCGWGVCDGGGVGGNGEGLEGVDGEGGWVVWGFSWEYCLLEVIFSLEYSSMSAGYRRGYIGLTALVNHVYFPSKHYGIV